MKRFLFLFSLLILAIGQMWAQSDPNYPISMTPAPGSEVTSPVAEVTFTYGKELDKSKFQTSFDTYINVYKGATGWNKYMQAKEIALSSDNKTITFKLPGSVTEGGVIRIVLQAKLFFKDGTQASAVEYTFTYAEPQLEPVSSLPGDGEPHEGLLTSYSLTYDQPITNTPAANGLKIYGLDSLPQNEYMTKPYMLLATSTKAVLSADKKTVTYTIALNYYGNEFYAELPYGALKGEGWTNAPVKRWITTYENPIVQLWGNGTQYEDGATVDQLDYIHLKYNQCSSTWNVSLGYAAFGTDNQGNPGVAWLQKKKGNEWIDYQTVKLRFPDSDDSKTAMIVPAVLNDKGNITERKSIIRPGQYRVVVPTGSVYTSPYKKKHPLSQLINQEMVVSFSIAGDESTELLSPLSTTPADKSKVSNQLSQFTLSYPMPITTVPQAQTLKVYDEAGSQLLGTATSVTVSADQKTITYTLATPVTTWGTVNVQIDGNVIGGEGWTNDPVSRRVNIQERRNIYAAMEENTWRIMNVEIGMEGEHGELQGNLYDYNGVPYPIYRKNGEKVKMDISAHGTTYDDLFQTCLVPIIQQSWMIGEGDYYVDLPAGYLRCPAETTTEDGETVVTRWIESEATRLEFHLGPQLTTEFTVNPKDGSTLSKIDEFVVTIDEAQVLYLAGKLLPSEYLLVSKDGGKPIKYLMYDADRDGQNIDANNEYASSDKIAIDTNNPNRVSFKIAEGFNTPNEDNFGFASSGTYTITIPAGMFEIDGVYYNTDMTFTYIVKNNVVETRKFVGMFEVTPAAGETLTSANQLQEIYVKFKDADNITMSNISATVKGDKTKNTYLTFASVTKVDGVTWKFTMNRNESVAEYQDENLVFTFAATVNADGVTKVYADLDVNMDADYNMNTFATTWRYMTPEEYGKNYVDFSPNHGEEVESLSIISVTPREEYKFYNTWVTDILDIYLNGTKMEGYYVKSTNNPSYNTGALTVYDANNQKATLTEPGVYTIHVPAGCFPVQDAANHEIMSKAETVSVKIAGETIVDINRDGDMNVGDVTALVDIVLGKDNVEPYKYDHKAADVNGDGKFDVSDVTALVNLILNKK